jgi:hypothetical protein
MHTFDYAIIGFLIACMIWAGAMAKPDDRLTRRGERRSGITRPSRNKSDPNHASDQMRTAKYSTDKIEVVTGTFGQAPPHAGKQVGPFSGMGKDRDR